MGKKERNREQPKLTISMDKGQSQTGSNSTVSNTFSPNQTRTCSLAGEKACSQQKLRDSIRLKYQSSQDICRFGGHLWPRCHITEKWPSQIRASLHHFETMNPLCMYHKLVKN